MSWIVCTTGYGYPQNSDGSRSFGSQTFPEKTVARVLNEDEQWVLVEFIHKDERWFVDKAHTTPVEMKRDWWHESDPERICNTCIRLLPNSAFGKDNKRVDGTYQRRPACKECKKAITKKKKQTLTKSQADREPQHGDKWKCPVCQHVFIAGVTARVTQDHDHDTGKFRDFICDRCNSGMGRFRNGVDAMIHAAEYLEKHGATR